MEREPLKIDGTQLTLGALFLIAGTLVYLVDRPVGSALFLAEYESIHRNFRNLPSLYGNLSGFVPEFFHPLAFSLLTAAFLRQRRSKVLACAAWFIANILFELGQVLDNRFLDLMPSVFMSISVTADFATALARGTFDPYDVVAVALGSSGALLIVLYGGNKECDHEERNSKS